MVVSVAYPCDCGAAWDLTADWLPSISSITPHTTNQGKGQNSKSKVQFLLTAYGFYIKVKLENNN